MKIDESWYVRPADKNFPVKINGGGVVVRKVGDKLLIALIRERKFSNYALPKGSVEKGESFVEAAKRETKEEAGLSDLKLICKLGAKERLTFERNYWAVTHYFLFITNQTNGIQDLQNGEDYEVGWFNVDNLPKFFWPEQKELIEENLGKIKFSFL